MGAQSNETAVLTGEELRTAFELATRFLERHRDSINALNVFPVPDGDTGTNMLLTMRSVNEESSKATDSSAAAVASAMARGALLGARGNSGVILSQFFHGLAQGLHGKDEINGEDLAQAFKLASRAADKSVSKPRGWHDAHGATVSYPCRRPSVWEVEGATGMCYLCGWLPWRQPKWRYPGRLCSFRYCARPGW